MLKVRWPHSARCRAFLAYTSTNLARLDVYSSVGNNDDANSVVAVGPEHGPALFTLLPDLTLSDLEYVFGAARRPLAPLHGLPIYPATTDITVTASHAASIHVWYDERSVVFAFGPDEDVMPFTHAVETCQGTIHLLFAEHDRWSGIWFTDLVLDDTTTAIDAWQVAHGWDVDAE